jgi:hypothetical protein
MEPKGSLACYIVTGAPCTVITRLVEEAIPADKTVNSGEIAGQTWIFKGTVEVIIHEHPELKEMTVRCVPKQLSCRNA